MPADIDADGRKDLSGSQLRIGASIYGHMLKTRSDGNPRAMREAATQVALNATGVQEAKGTSGDRPHKEMPRLPSHDNCHGTRVI